MQVFTLWYGHILLGTLSSTIHSQILSTLSLFLPFQEVELGEACLYNQPELAKFLLHCGVNVNVDDFVSDLYDTQLYISVVC